MRLEVIQDLVLDRPLEETQLAHRRVHAEELNALPPTERIEHLFAIGLEMGFVGKIHNDMPSRLGDIRNVVLLCIVRHQPIHETQTDLRLSSNNLLCTRKNVGVAVKSRESMQNELIFALNVHSRTSIPH